MAMFLRERSDESRIVGDRWRRGRWLGSCGDLLGFAGEKREGHVPDPRGWKSPLGYSIRLLRPTVCSRRRQKPGNGAYFFTIWLGLAPGRSGSRGVVRLSAGVILRRRFAAVVMMVMTP